MAARKAAQVTYLSAYQSFCKRAVITIYDYFKDSCIAIRNNTYYIISVVIPVLGSVALSGLINHYRALLKLKLKLCQKWRWRQIF